MKRFLFAFWVLTLAACARPVVPEGGPKDTTPPAVVPEKSTPNYTTHFEGRVIKLTFDEWITLQDVGAQVLISPPLAKRPEITLKKKTVNIKFQEEEVLRPNTTYTINFGTSVKDLHENNPAKDLRFVFSTGDFIDSLSVAGVVIDAFTGEPADNITVMLYDSEADSIIRKERPYYVARTDKSGQFTIPNVRTGTFKCVAIDDANQNLKWDGDSERIGFPEQAVTVQDSIQNILAIKIFKPVPPLRLITQNAKQYGMIQLGFTGPTDSIVLEPDIPDLKFLTERMQDSILFWYDLPEAQAWKLVSGLDTVSVKALARADFMEKNRVDFADEKPTAAGAQRRGNRQPALTDAAAAPIVRPARTVSVDPNKPVLLPFEAPVSAFDTAKWMLVLDSTSLRDFEARPDSANPRSIRLATNWVGGKSYKLQLLPGAVTDLYGTMNTDTLRRIFTAPTEKQLGTLNLTVESLHPGQHYVLRLLNGNAVEEERFFAPDSSKIRFVFPKLQPVAFTATLIEDRNDNQRWDPGDYFAHRQPELVFSRKLDPLRADWEVEATLDISADSGRRKRTE